MRRDGRPVSPSASAHAASKSITPADNARLKAAPSAIVIEFTVVNRYSRIAAGSVAVLVVTRVYATLNELDAGIGELIGSAWGRLILVKALCAHRRPLRAP